MRDLNDTNITVTYDHTGEEWGYPTIAVELETKWDTSITLDFTVEDARQLAAQLLRHADTMSDA